MKSYRNTDTGVFYRTLAEVRGMNFNPVEIPTSQAELIAFINSLAPPVLVGEIHDEKQWEVSSATLSGFPLLSQEDMDFHRATGAQIPKSEEDRAAFAARYRNGDPTTPYLKSRDPAARFTCTSCGVVNDPR